MTPGWVAELGLDRPTGWPAMGVRADPSPWPAPADPARLDLRRALLWQHPACAAALPGSEAAVAEVVDLVHAAAATAAGPGAPPPAPGRPPPAARPSGGGPPGGGPSGAGPSGGGASGGGTPPVPAPAAGCCGSPGVPLEGAAAALAEVAVAQGDDLCVLAPEPGWPLVAGVVLFPSHWRLADKLGTPLGGVHDRVPGYPSDQVDHFLERLEPGRAVWRRNLLVHRDGELHAPDAATHDVPVERWWLRSERQTLRRLPRTGAVLFTIGTDTAPLADLDAPTRHALAHRLESFPPTWAPYAGVAAELPRLAAWLRTA